MLQNCMNAANSLSDNIEAEAKFSISEENFSYRIIFVGT